jgi:hypothetical protein
MGTKPKATKFVNASRKKGVDELGLLLLRHAFKVGRWFANMPGHGINRETIHLLSRELFKVLHQKHL